MEECCLGGQTPANFDWIEAAVTQLLGTTPSADAIGVTIQRWLTYISLAPERRVHASGRNATEFQAEVNRRRSELQCRIDGLSEPERQLLAGLVPVDHDTTRLSTLCFRLLADRDLEPFGPALVYWAFSDRLNGPIFSPADEFGYLLRFNSRDWTASRAALLAALERLLPVTSIVGAKTKQLVFWATGDLADAQAAQLIQQQINPEARTYIWTHLSTFCTSDPCDPATEEPPNLAATADRFAGLAMRELHQYMGQINQDMFFRSARTAVARFRPEVAIDSALTLDTAKPLHLDYGYCSTVHAAQGKTAERVLIDADTKSATANESAYYVAISRARFEVDIYTDDKALLPEAMGREDIKHAALDVQPKAMEADLDFCP